MWTGVAPTGARLVLPGLILLAAAVVAVVGPRGLAPGLALGAVFLVVVDATVRCAFAGVDDRERERRARWAFRRTGRWPDDVEDRDGTDAPDGDGDGDGGRGKGRRRHDRVGRPDGAPPASADHARRAEGRDRSRRRPPRRRP